MSDVSRILKEARNQARLTTLDYAEQIFDDFMELHGDRHFADDGAIVGGIGLLDGKPVTVIGVQKGKTYRIILIVILASRIRKATVRLCA